MHSVLFVPIFFFKKKYCFLSFPPPSHKDILVKQAEPPSSLPTLVTEQIGAEKSISSTAFAVDI